MRTSHRNILGLVMLTEHQLATAQCLSETPNRMPARNSRLFRVLPVFEKYSKPSTPSGQRLAKTGGVTNLKERTTDL